jgi:hypothetical protein
LESQRANSRRKRSNTLRASFPLSFHPLSSPTSPCIRTGSSFLKNPQQHPFLFVHHTSARVFLLMPPAKYSSDNVGSILAATCQNATFLAASTAAGMGGRG